MKSNPLKNNLEERQAIKIRAAQYAFDHLDGMDNRTGLILLRNGVMKSNVSVSEDRYMVEVLSNPSHEDRLPISPGPIVAHYMKGDKKQAQVIEVAPLLLSRDKIARVAAFNHFRGLIAACRHVKPERLESLLDQHKGFLFSDEVAHWSVSAVAVFDVVTDDFFLNLAGVRQCIELNYDMGLNQFLPKVFEPSMTSVEWIELLVSIPSRQHSEIENIIKDTVSKSHTFVEACTLYYQSLGTIPLARSFALSRVFDEWVNLNRDVQNIWQLVWDWATKTHSPLGRYHAIQLFCAHPSLIPKEGFALLWNEIDQMVVSSFSKSRDVRWTQETLLRCELAQHFLKYFESRRPARNSEAVARFAWWLSEQIALVFANQPKIIDWVRSSVLKDVQIRANYPWQTGAPPLEPSTLRLATIFISSPWSLALESQISNNLASLKYADVDSQQRLRFEQAIGESLLFWFIPESGKEENLTFAFESKINDENVAGYIQNEIQAKSFRDLMGERKMIKNADDILKRLQTIMEFDPQHQAITVFAFRCYAYLSLIPANELWKTIADEKWNKRVFLSMDSTIVQIFFESLIAVQIVGGDLWRCNLPHLLARLAETAHGETERKKILFLFTILSSITGDTVSGIERVLKGRYRNDFAEEVSFWRTQFTRIMQLSPPWAAARIRPIIGSLALT